MKYWIRTKTEYAADNRCRTTAVYRWSGNVADDPQFWDPSDDRGVWRTSSVPSERIVRQLDIEGYKPLSEDKAAYIILTGAPDPEWFNV